MLWIAKFQKFAGINCRESKKSQNVTLYDLDLKDAVTGETNHHPERIESNFALIRGGRILVMSIFKI